MNKLSIIRKHFIKNNDDNNDILNVEKENPKNLLPFLNENFADKINIAVGSLENILNNPHAMSYLIQYMENINHLNYMKFLIHTKSFSEVSPPSYNEAVFIFDMYFTPKSILSLFDDSIIEKIKNSINSKTITSILYKDAVLRVKEIISKRYLESFLSSVYYKSYLVECLNDSPLSLADVFNIDQLLCSFIEFLDTENDRKYLEFIIAVNSFLEDYNTSMEDKNLMEDAMIIYEKYISMQAFEALDFGDSVRVQVEQQICSLHGKPSKDCFKIPYDLAKKLLQIKSIPQYMESLFFIKLKKELKYTIDMMNDVANHSMIKNEYIDRKSIPYDDDNISISNTAISSATENSWPLTPRKEKIKEHSLGKVDNYGRYSPLYDSKILNSQPTHTPNKIKQKIENLLSLSAKKESQVADQVAQLIINDIQNMINNGGPEA
uniref:A-kinase anchor protein 10, mitochondrial (inferred by orthology to a human protein) n=1 Tax=Strongyloides venezuelensis TaxID=75913 RepID=A0A0K0F8W0_STRVS